MMYYFESKKILEEIKKAAKSEASVKTKKEVIVALLDQAIRDIDDELAEYSITNGEVTSLNALKEYYEGKQISLSHVTTDEEFKKALSWVSADRIELGDTVVLEVGLFSSEF